MNKGLIYLTARALCYGDKMCSPDKVQELWDSLSEEDRLFQIDRATTWLEELKNSSPKTYKFLKDNHDEL